MKGLSVAKRIHQTNKLRIYEELRREPGTFEALINRTGLSRATVNQCLKELDQEGLIEREYKEKHLLIKLSRKALDPGLTAVLRLGALPTLRGVLNPKGGRKLLESRVRKTLIRIDATALKPAGVPWRYLKFGKEGAERYEPEFDELVLWVGLAIYDAERNHLPYELPKEELVALPIVETSGLSRKLDALLDWIQPVIKGHPLLAHLWGREIHDHVVRLFTRRIERLSKFRSPFGGGGEKPRK